MYYNKGTEVFLNGKWLKAEDAKVSLYNQTMHYGLGAFEGIRSYATDNGTRIFKAKEHYDRLLYSVKQLNVKLDYSVDQLIDISYELLKRNNLSDAYLRPLVYLGENMGLAPSQETNLFMAAWNWDKLLGDKLLRVGVSSYQRPNPNAVPVDAKLCGHYPNSSMATQEAKQNGFDEALLLDMNGFVAEGPGANFFLEKDEKLYTCPTTNILPGITRATVLELCKEASIPVEERFFTPEEVLNADGAFFVGTAAEVAGIESVNDVLFKKSWEMTFGAKLQKLYQERVLEKSTSLV